MGFPGGKIIRVTPTLSTNAYAQGDILFNPTKIPNAVSNRGGISILQAMYIVDYADVADDALTHIIITEGNTDLGTINATANISDADFSANKLNGILLWDNDQATTTSRVDNLRIHQMFSAAGLNTPISPLMLLQATDGSTDVYVSAILASNTTPTYAADSLELIFHIKYLG